MYCTPHVSLVRNVEIETNINLASIAVVLNALQLLYILNWQAVLEGAFDDHTFVYLARSAVFRQGPHLLLPHLIREHLVRLIRLYSKHLKK